MKSFFVAALLAVIASTASALIVNTPANAVQCQPLLITWDPQGSAGPFFLSVHPGDNPSGPALYSWEGLTGTSFTWNVPVASGTSLGLLLRDTTGASSQSAPFTVQPGSTTSCPVSSSSASLPSGTSSLPTGSSSSSIVSSTRTTTTTTTSSTTKPPTSISTPTSVRPSSTSSPSPTSTGGAGGNVGGALNNAVGFGSAGFLAAIVGAVLA